MKGSKNNY